MATEEQLDVSRLDSSILNNVSWGQRLTISNRVVSKLSFYLKRDGSPGGILTFKIRKVSNDDVIVAKLWGNCDDVSTDPSWLEVTFDAPTLVNEEVYILATASSGSTGNVINVYSSYPDDVKASEWAVQRSSGGSYTEYESNRDFGYIYTYSSSASPTVTTQIVTSISGTTATGKGNVTGLGNPVATQHGHCWNTTGTPDVDDSKTENGAPSATGAFTSSLTGLTAGTKYYVRAYIINAVGTVYGSQVVFWADKGTVSPTDAVARVSSIRHIFRPGFFRMQVGLGDLGFDVDVAEATVRSELEQEYVVKPGAKEAIEKALADTPLIQKALEESRRKESARKIEEALAATPLLQEALRAPKIEAALAATPLLQKAIEESRRRKEERLRATRGWTG